MRTSPDYVHAQKRDVFAMIRQLGPPSLFFTLTFDDVHCKPLLAALAQPHGVEHGIEGGDGRFSGKSHIH